MAAVAAAASEEGEEADADAEEVDADAEVVDSPRKPCFLCFGKCYSFK